jgi:hypothetical protein
VVELLPSKHETLNSNPIITEREREREIKRERKREREMNSECFSSFWLE